MNVSNTSTLILISKIDLLRTFLEKFGHINIPDKVYEEFIEKDSFENKVILKEIKNKKIIVNKVNINEYIDIIKDYKLHEGEAAAYALHLKHKSKLILTDDKELIKLCRVENVPFICALAIVVMLLEKKVLNKESAIEKLNQLQGYGRYSRKIFDYYLAQVK